MSEITGKVIEMKRGDESIFSRFIGKSQHIKEVIKTAKKLAQTNATVLITGETGTGKSLIARLIHQKSLRSKGPFIKVDCAAVPATLIESEIFGHQKGAFTGAFQNHLGKLERADRGTLLLDEIGDTGLLLQPKLLGCLEPESLEGTNGEKITFERVGGGREMFADVRFIATTNKDLRGKMEEGEFRQDLFYRLNQTQIRLIPLRERPEDIPVLIDYFLNMFSRIYQKEVKLGQTKRYRLIEYNWPGNVRELKNVIRGFFLGLSNELSNQPIKKGGEKVDKGDEKTAKSDDKVLEVLLKSMEIIERQTGAIIEIVSRLDRSEIVSVAVDQLKEEIALMRKLQRSVSGTKKRRISFKTLTGKKRYPGHKEVLRMVKEARGDIGKAARVNDVPDSTFREWVKRAKKEEALSNQLSTHDSKAKKISPKKRNKYPGAEEIFAMIEKAGGKISRAADNGGIPRPTMSRWRKAAEKERAEGEKSK